MIVENIWIILLLATLYSGWGILLLRTFSLWIFSLKKLNFVSIVLPFFLQFSLQIFFFLGPRGISPYITIFASIFSNLLILLFWVKANYFHALIISTIYSIVVLNVDMLIVLLLTVLRERGIIEETNVGILSFGIMALLLAPFVYFGLRYVTKLEETQRYEFMKKLRVVLTAVVIIISILVNVFFEYIPLDSWVRGVDLWMLPFVMLLFLFSMLAGNEIIYTQQSNKARDLEYQALQQYTKDIELQSREVQKFRHDYINILMSLERYVQESDKDDLKNFFYSKLLDTSESLYKDAESELQQLRNVKDREIKSVLLVKMQNMISAGVKVEFEAIEEIEITNIDVVIMVRIIGILLDNAFEETSGKKNQMVNVGLVKTENDIIFYVSNTCSTERISMKTLVEKGYTTKGKARGIGLSNLAEFSEKYENLFIETKCENYRFTQIITIGG